MNRNSLSYVVLAVGAVAGMVAASVACTPEQRGIVRSVIDVVEEVCKDSPSPRDCLARTHIAMATQPGFDPTTTASPTVQAATSAPPMVVPSASK